MNTVDLSLGRARRATERAAAAYALWLALGPLDIEVRVVRALVRNALAAEEKASRAARWRPWTPRGRRRQAEEVERHARVAERYADRLEDIYAAQPRR